MSVRRANRAGSRGVTLIELLIGLAVGAIVLLAVIAAWGLSVRSAAYTMESARLNNDLRSTMQIMSQDLRRADGGLDIIRARAVRFSPAGDCVTYYVEGEPRGYRLTEAGEFQVYAPSSTLDAPACESDDPDYVEVNTDGGQDWFGLYDQLADGQFRITDFTASWQATCYPFDGTTPLVRTSGSTPDTYQRCVDGGTNMTDVTEVLEVTLSLTGEIGAGASGTKRMTVQDTITVRNNDVR
jgi:prepilin-type N-terminal cleavage/methylation domain-containing protein